ncbi:hypothetical protein ACFFLS_11655 [Flavobacterium procerum]|uniref:HEAT repeat domain-containing protein n=1 Tax=Flavobacterium procerum TaxID=1455569 RepID=A0ABV6BRT7_9FLAO
MDLGVFNDFWDGKPNHLPLLSLIELPGDENQSFNLKWSLFKLEAILKANTQEAINEGIKSLLEQEDWRLHLVAATSLLSLKQSKRENLNVLFWERLTRGSWVSPQILVALSISDTSFKTKGEKILLEGFTINYSQMSAIEHHVSRGGVPTTVSEKKVEAALNYLLNDTINNDDDNDSGGSIAQNWKERLDELITENKFKLGHF